MERFSGKTVIITGAAVARFGGIDVLVSNAGISIKKAFAELTLEDWKTTLAVDLDGVFYCAQVALPHLIKSKGSIIHTASVSGLGGDWGMTAYNAAKGVSPILRAHLHSNSASMACASTPFAPLLPKAG
jgi:NADP-dependent 3-hydroxy acid dehydrogenase YdfG